MADKHRYIVAHFSRRAVRRDEVDLFLVDLSHRIEQVRTMLYDMRQTSFTLVTIPEMMSVRETERYLTLLLKEGVPVTDLIVNRVEHQHDDCRYCQARVASQHPWLKEIARLFPRLRSHFVPLLPDEVRGLEALRLFAGLTWDQAEVKVSTKTRAKAQRKLPAKELKKTKKTEAFLFATRSIFIFGGKGGVGKTTAAAAFSLALARKERRKQFLVFSTDPAHSLSDSFDEPVAEFKRRIAGVKNLDAMEINPGKKFEELKQRYRSWTDDLFASLSGGSQLEIKFDQEAMRELVELTPPGIDEIAALSAISDLLDRGEYDTTILDTAPTGHLIRFLELPQVALSWIRTFIKLLLKYQHVVHANKVAEELIALSKSIKRVITLLTDVSLCEFIGVAIPERMSLEETAALAASLKKLKVPMRRLLINGLVPEEAASSCDFCDTRRKAQVSVIEEFRDRFARSLELFVATQQPNEINGAKDLLEHFAQWQPLDNSMFQSDRKAELHVNKPAVKNIRRGRKTRR
jgi:arsenite-transporting ATPase